MTNINNNQIMSKSEYQEIEKMAAMGGIGSDSSHTPSELENNIQLIELLAQLESDDRVYGTTQVYQKIQAFLKNHKNIDPSLKDLATRMLKAPSPQACIKVWDDKSNGGVAIISEFFSNNQSAIENLINNLGNNLSSDQSIIDLGNLFITFSDLMMDKGAFSNTLDQGIFQELSNALSGNEADELIKLYAEKTCGGWNKDAIRFYQMFTAKFQISGISKDSNFGEIFQEMNPQDLTPPTTDPIDIEMILGDFYDAFSDFFNS